MATQEDDLTPDTSMREGADSELFTSSSSVNVLSLEGVPDLGATSSLPDGDIAEYYGELSSQAIQITSGWADGMYDFASAPARFDWADINLTYDAEFDWMHTSTNDIGMLF
jgi:hypothetical protein